MSIADKEKGLYNKYEITKTSGYSIDSDAKFFVLRYDKNQKDKYHHMACRIALNAYADAIRPHIPKLASDLDWELEHQ